MCPSEDLLWPGLGGEDDKGPYLQGGICRSCGHVVLGERTLCPECWSEHSITLTPIGRSGRLYTRTTIHALPNGFDEPYTVGYVDLPEGLRVFAHLERGVGAPAIGDMVELTFAPLRKDKNGRLGAGPLYRKAAAKGAE
jgi:uncharacterized OB-fold protein